MRRIDKLLVQRPDLPAITDEAAWRAHQEAAIKRLREITFRYTLSDRVPRRRDFRADGSDSSGTCATYVFDSFDGMTIGIKTKRPPRSSVAHPHAGLRGATGRAQHLRGRRFFPARRPRRVRDRGRRGAQHRRRRRSAPAICGRRGGPIRSWAKRSPSARSAICSPPSRCCGRSR